MSAAAIWMTTVAMSINVAVLIPVTAGLMHEVERMNNVFGSKTPARDILLCIYLAILLLSAVLAVALHFSNTQKEALSAAAGLMAVQVIYKVLTGFIVSGGVPPGLPHNPVIISNQVIAAFHVATLGAVIHSSRAQTLAKKRWKHQIR